MPSTNGAEWTDLAGAVARDTQRLVALHADLLRSELREELAEARRAAGAMGAGAGLVAAGGLLGSLTAVHGLQRATRLPLWGCYGLVSGLLTAAGAGMLVAGARWASRLDLVPRQTIEALRENVSWLKDQATRPPA